MDINAVELAGLAESVKGGETRNGGYWLLVNVRVETDGRTISIPVWWFGGKDQRDIYLDVKEDARVRALGELRWSLNRDEEWELRVVARILTVDDGEGEDRRNGRSERRERRERRERNGRTGNGRNGAHKAERRRRTEEEEEEELPF